MKLRRRVEAADWEETAVAELAAELDLDLEALDHSDDRSGFPGNAITVEGDRGSNGESEWLVFEDVDDAEDWCRAYVIQDLEDEPEIFNQQWLEGFISISSTDIRIVAGEEADHYIEDIKEDEERLIEEADMERQFEKLEDAKDTLEERVEEDSDDPKALKRWTKALEKLDKQREKLLDQAEDAVRDKYYEDAKDQLESDPSGWAEDLGYGPGNWPTFFSLDVEKAAESAIQTDGVDHFLDRYDGSGIELPSGAVAYGTN